MDKALFENQSRSDGQRTKAIMIGPVKRECAAGGEGYLSMVIKSY